MTEAQNFPRLRFGQKNNLTEFAPKIRVYY
jgi:hypothetical protein